MKNQTFLSYGHNLAPGFVHQASASSKKLISHLLASLSIREHHTPAIGEVRVGPSERPRECFLHGRPLQRSLKRRKTPLFFNAPEAIDAIAFGESNARLRERKEGESSDGKMDVKAERLDPATASTEKAECAHTHPWELQSFDESRGTGP